MASITKLQAACLTPFAPCASSLVMRAVDDLNNRVLEANILRQPDQPRHGACFVLAWLMTSGKVNYLGYLDHQDKERQSCPAVLHTASTRFYPACYIPLQTA